MRGVFFKKFKEQIKEDESLFFLTAATGYHLVEEIFEVAPERSLNVGIAESNMIGIAAGLVNAGFVPVCYALTNFLVQRSFEQIRNDICLHEHKIILLGTSAGYDQGALGATHHKVDDIGVLKTLPNIRIYSPSGKKSMNVIIKEALDAKHASFIRISKGGYTENNEIDSPNHFIHEIESQVLVISHGKMVSNASTAYEQLPVFSLYAMDRIKPLDSKILMDLFLRFETIVVIEDNFRSGLYNSLCQWVIEKEAPHRKLISISPEEAYDDILGDSDYLEDKHGLTPEKIIERMKFFL